MPPALVLPPPLQDERQDDGRRVLSRALVCDLGELVVELHVESRFGATLSEQNTTRLTVPAGFNTDYSSIPSLLVPIMGRWDRHDLAGIYHDWCYRQQVPRAVADRVWWIIAQAGTRHVGPVRAWLGWAGLRIGGWVAYRNRTRGPAQ